MQEIAKWTQLGGTSLLYLSIFDLSKNVSLLYERFTLFDSVVLRRTVAAQKRT